MTPDDFKAWRTRMATLRGGRYSQAAAARDLGRTPLMVKLYEKQPTTPGAPPPHPIPRYIALACAALEVGLAPL